MAIKKKFALGYNSRDMDHYNYHVDLSVSLNTRELSSMCAIYGINTIKESPMHLCIQVGALAQCTPLEMCESIIGFLETIGYENIGSIAYDIVEEDKLIQSKRDEFIKSRGMKTAGFVIEKEPIFNEPESQEVDVEKVKEDLAKAVENEDYLEAAKLRDFLAQYEEEQNNK